jgi:hypothetical protein
VAAPPTDKRRILVAAAIVVILAGAGIFLMRRGPAGRAAAGIKRVAVLPF